MEAYGADAFSTVKNHTVCIFDAQTVDFCGWLEQMTFYLMVNGLYSGLLDGEDTGDKKTLAQWSLACYGIININLSDACRDVCAQAAGYNGSKEVLGGSHCRI